jgi:hypothetical protein
MKKLCFRVLIGLALASCSPLAVLAQVTTYNYNIGSPDCKPLTGVTAKVKFTQTVINDAASGDLGFQLSAWSLTRHAGKPPFVKWQQYMTGVTDLSSPANVNPTIQTFNITTTGLEMVKGWGAVGFLNLGPMTLTPPDGQGVLVIPAGHGIIAGSEFTIALQNDNDGRVTGATFGAADFPNGLTTQPASVSQPLAQITGPMQQAHPAPIVGFQFDFTGGTVVSPPPWIPAPVGKFQVPPLPLGQQIPVGTITYTASSPMTVLSNSPSCAAASTSVVTAETTNSYYDPLSPAQGPSQTLTQTFGILYQQASPYTVTIPSCPQGEVCSTCPASCGLAGCFLPKPGPNGVIWQCKESQRSSP